MKWKMVAPRVVLINRIKKAGKRGEIVFFFAFMLSVSLSRGLSPDDINELAEFCAILSNCLTYISGREQYFIE